ncbi:MAG: UDP-galactose-lipid carrier transferase [Acidobacteria bacterium]|nr:UDP-galactose-lipid carrier transferase [Acidobacteriota bacterium]
MSAEESEKRVAAAQKRLLHLRLFSAGLLGPAHHAPGMLVLFEGFDAAGKGGAIRRLTAGLDPRHVLVVPIGAPSPIELRHHFLWRFAPSLPGLGGMTVYDRSWYGRLLVERVNQLIDEQSVRRSAKEIVDFEDSLVNDGVAVVKFWLHISDAEQLRRFNDRAANPAKQWKLTEDDWHNRSLRPQYLHAIKDMIDWTDHSHAHWDLVAAEDKRFARVFILETLIKRWERDLQRHGFTVPASHGTNYLA